jgi:hypothetical protein
MRTLYWFGVIKVARFLSHVHPPAANWLGYRSGLVLGPEWKDWIVKPDGIVDPDAAREGPGCEDTQVKGFLTRTPVGV